MNFENLVFLDFEASSLSNSSYPIAVGWVSPQDECDSFLICPHLAWTDWCQLSEDIHKIPRRRLFMEGVSARNAMLELNRTLHERTVICGSNYDLFWLSRLTDAANTSPIFKMNVWTDLSFISKSNYFSIGDEIAKRITHNPLDDAQALMKALSSALG